MNIEDMYRIFLVDDIRYPTKEEIEDGIDNIEPFCYCEDELQAGYAVDRIGEAFVAPPGKTVEDTWFELTKESLKEIWSKNK